MHDGVSPRGTETKLTRAGTPTRAPGAFGGAADEDEGLSRRAAAPAATAGGVVGRDRPLLATVGWAKAEGAAGSQDPRRAAEEAEYDMIVEQSFPASDPPPPKG